VARALKEKYGDFIALTITADKFYDQTTSFAAGGLWEPHLLGDTDPDLVLRWSELSYLHYQSLYFSADAANAGVQQIKVHNLYSDEDNNGEIAPTPVWAGILGLEFSCPGPQELAAMGYPAKYTHAHSFNSYVADPKFFLDFLMRNLKEAGVIFEEKTISRIQDQLLLRKTISDTGACHRMYDIVINCSGLGAHHTEEDSSMFPIRGQVLRVKAPWVKTSCTFGSSYVIPNVNSLVVGGTGQVGNWSTEPSVADTEAILNGVSEMFPSLRQAQVLETNVGLRPCRPSVRLDSELLLPSAFTPAGQWASGHSGCNTSGRPEQLLVRCYGLGGSGYTLAPGVAQDVVEKHIHPYIKGMNTFRGSLSSPLPAVLRRVARL